MCLRSTCIVGIRAVARETYSGSARNRPIGADRRPAVVLGATRSNEMLHVRVCAIRRENTEEAFGFELWRSRRRSSNSAPEHDDSSDLLIVKSVYPGSPAEKGDLRENDKIIAVDGTNVRDARSVRDLLATALEVRVMVERWEGPNVQAVVRKSSTPTAPQRSVRAQPPEPSRRRSNTIRNVLDANLGVQQWPRNYGSAQNYPSSDSNATPERTSSSAARQTALHSQVSSDDGHLPESNSNAGLTGRRKNDAVGSSESNDCGDGDQPRRSILDICPEGRFLLNIAGRGFYSDDLRGD